MPCRGGEKKNEISATEEAALKDRHSEADQFIYRAAGTHRGAATQLHPVAKDDDGVSMNNCGYYTPIEEATGRKPRPLRHYRQQQQQQRSGSLKSFALGLLERRPSIKQRRKSSPTNLNEYFDAKFEKAKSAGDIATTAEAAEVIGRPPPPLPPDKPRRRHGGGGCVIVKEDEVKSAVRAIAPLLTTALNKVHEDVITSSIRPDMSTTSEKLLKTARLRNGGLPATTLSLVTDGTTSNQLSALQANSSILEAKDIQNLSQADFENDYDVVQKIGEGWFSKVYLAEHRQTRQEVVLKAVDCGQDRDSQDFLREYHNTYLLSSHANVVTVYDVIFRLDRFCMFAVEYAPFGDLTSNVTGDGVGIGEQATKSVTKQIGSALDWVHNKNLCHLDVKLDNILVFRSDFSRVKLCDFGSVRTQGDIVIKKNELLPYCPPELFARHANEYYQVDRTQDVFQFGIVVYYCLFGVLPWQRADITSDPRFADFYEWVSGRRRLRPAAVKTPRNFKTLGSRGEKLFRKLLDPDPATRMQLSDLPKYSDARWLQRSRTPRGSSLSLGAVAAALSAAVASNDTQTVALESSVSKPTPEGETPAESAALAETKRNCDGVSQLTMGSFQSVHSNAMEKNRVLYTLLQAGVETTVDRCEKNSRIINWIQHGQSSSDPPPPPPPPPPQDKRHPPPAFDNGLVAAAVDASQQGHRAHHIISNQGSSDEVTYSVPDLLPPPLTENGSE